MKLKAVHNKRLGRWQLCHDQWCKPGETSIVAIVLTSEDPEADERRAKLIEARFNEGDALQRSRDLWKETAEFVLKHATPTGWRPKMEWAEDDQPIPEDAQIEAAHPMISEAPNVHGVYAEALRMVSAKRSKYALVDLVHWLLMRHA
ncbi:hypothetical protein [Inquilinus limosus]|uniref:Uncharacterized protein n=1 Tax=Inquilinus limosus MP06 TaxID=1398085 RepID=A0A0A0DE41_9PROT|nr:hypothetical protein [Inquilinus limosus]KGM36168.1 hypothetical protein P409_00540 [Inquilinus limosus MP06]